ncbi:2-oxoglutarate dehydrogenase complex dihydrolipoyllysine-residue succinyltransferase [Chengkuizengella axinellae]|uniref:Dihydrolipoyllysine-residue succinyltransferase component of 2-oxoglutarate dehydrogenase complex n=1 Tax=Chengkuizengella axinellae TaxID=3064388 RepID=A0ABT9J0G2_9BACL|nr:2-oxoglutarate dehydrogenase complex dihydrolipoyllysine-residue succinyltransferase [Chengkuizengella sp. 2205SS18-9]MDP5275111.1 2-oxoglutarate dehydrogenase complex dihydrolipoyllysine-residue succinyltransferase [Chengkuizengella sp. 2205SS18-9]
MANIIIPELAETITEGTIMKWMKKQGDKVEINDVVLELETDKVNVEIISEHSGILKQILFKEGDTVNVGDAVAVVEEGAEGVDSSADSKQTQMQGEQKEIQSAEHFNVSAEQDKIKTNASPAARKMAREKGINLNEVTSVSPMGTVNAQDVSTHITLTKLDEASITDSIHTSPSLHVKEEDGKPVERIRMSRRRQTIANRLVEVQQTTAMLTTFNEVDMTNVLSLRKRRKEQFFEENDVKLGFMSFFTKAVVAALKKYPYLNAEIQDEEILIKKYYDIGIAVSAPDGLVVPIVRDADRKNFSEIEKNILNLANKARSNKLGLSDLQGGTFTITNGGIFGSLMSTPILNGPQVGILGMHSIQLRPVSIDETKMENRPMMYIALSYDHRIVDGKEAVSFLVKVKQLIEDPEFLLLEA